MFVQRRTKDKDIYPGYFDVAAGGVVQAGESYDESAQRELTEELGIRGVELDPLFDFYHEEFGNRVWGRAYACTYDGNIVLQKEEIQSGAFFPITEIVEMIERRRFTPDGLYVFQRFLARRSDRKTVR